MGVIILLFLAAGALHRYLTLADPFDFSELPPRAVLWMAAYSVLANLLVVVPRAGSLIATVVLVEAWLILARCLREQTLALLSLPIEQQHRVLRATRWTFAALVGSSILALGSWLY